ncbi:hypothetical protein POM88_046370 [Heracleum sosnowskyi]|uniref:Uncharacterized protein n=1 Tax=Heracleum sosnowskyi TaxID=360622 RepID=A0AAD8H7M3_9APIA|nr:hypothetical protein POM88_046370 [Heracleum sosnowskyi]
MPRSSKGFDVYSSRLPQVGTWKTDERCKDAALTQNLKLVQSGPYSNISSVFSGFDNSEHNAHELLSAGYSLVKEAEKFSRLASTNMGYIILYVPNPVLIIIDVQPKESGIPTKAYCALEEVKEVVKEGDEKLRQD